MRVKLICCDVFLRPVSAFVAVSPNIIDVEYVPMLAHTDPARLRAELQTRIDAAAALRKYDMFVLAYGLCGNAVTGLTCPVPLVIPRIHDCCTMFMGSREKYLAEFGNRLSMRWCSCGYYERCYMDERTTDYVISNRDTNPEFLALVEQYGQENAEYVWETMHPEIETPEAAYIVLEGFEIPGRLEGFSEEVEKQGKTLVTLNGDLTFLRDLINGPWDSARFQTVMPGQKIAAVYDMEHVITAVDA